MALRSELGPDPRQACGDLLFGDAPADPVRHHKFSSGPRSLRPRSAASSFSDYASVRRNLGTALVIVAMIALYSGMYFAWVK